MKTIIDKYNDYIRTIDMIIGYKIKSLRKAKGFTRTDFAEKLGVTEYQLQKYEYGEKKISVGGLSLIVKQFNESFEYFYSDLKLIGFKNDPNFRQREDVLTSAKQYDKCIELVKNFMRIENPAYIEAINNLVIALIGKPFFEEKDKEVPK